MSESKHGWLAMYGITKIIKSGFNEWHYKDY